MPLTAAKQSDFAKVIREKVDAVREGMILTGRRAHQWGSHGEALGHPDKCLVDSAISVRVVLSQHLSHHSRTFSAAHHPLHSCREECETRQMLQEKKWCHMIRQSGSSTVPVWLRWQEPQIMHGE